MKNIEKLISDYTPIFYITYKNDNEFESLTIYYLSNKKILITGSDQYISTSAVLILTKFMN